MSKALGYLKALGPGLLWAATAVGVSHLVQSTRAGAGYGFALVWLILLTNLLKYPLFEAGPRYAVATGRSLLEGYIALGRWAVVLYLILTVGSMFTVLAAVTLVTAGLGQALFGSLLPMFGGAVLGWAVALLALCLLILVVGRFAALDRLTKVIVVVLVVSTTAAFLLALAGRADPAAPALPVVEVVWDEATLAFLVALLGWMPTGLDMAAWHSLWTLERARQTGHRPTWRQARFDFNLGYVGTAVISLMFLTLGALVLRPSGEPLAATAGGFAAQLVDIYTMTLGEWSRPIILLAAFTTMFSTVLAVSDGFPRVLARLRTLLIGREEGEERSYWLALAILMAGALVFIVFLRQRFTQLIDLATTLSFLTAPLIGYLNLRAATGPRVPAELQPPMWWRALAWAGLLLLAGLGLVYVVWRFT